MHPFGAGENVWLLDSQEHMEENLNIFDFELSQDPLESGVFKLWWLWAKWKKTPTKIHRHAENDLQATVF